MSIHTNQLSRSMCMAVMCMMFLLPFAVYAGGTTSGQLKRGQQIYKQFCQSCHGDNLQGQENWRKRKPDGKLPAPPHDETGHTWHHDDTLLFAMTKFGLVPPYAPANYNNDMPAFENLISDDDIHAVIAFIKSRWPKKAQKIQNEINDQRLQRLSK